jgi:hypothetical protein
MKMVPTEVTETSTFSIHTPGNYPKEENTRYHRTLLHQNRREQMSKAPEVEAYSTKSEEMSLSPTEPKQGSYCSFKEQRASQVLLAKVTDSWGTQQPCRVLLDGGSQSSCITEAFAR